MKIEINLKIIFIIILFFLIDNLSTYGIFIIFILIHELAHLVVGILIGGKPKKMTISPFGMSLEFYSYGKNKIFYKILFFSSGPLINLVIALLFNFLYNKNDLIQIIIYINVAIGIFNLLPILPLDGGKLLREIAKGIVGFEKANKFIIYFSKIVLMCITFIYAILIVKVKNIMILLLILYLWHLYYIEEKKYNIYEKANNSIKKII